MRLSEIVKESDVDDNKIVSVKKERRSRHLNGLVNSLCKNSSELSEFVDGMATAGTNLKWAVQEVAEACQRLQSFFGKH